MCFGYLHGIQEAGVGLEHEDEGVAFIWGQSGGKPAKKQYYVAFDPDNKHYMALSPNTPEYDALDEFSESSEGGDSDGGHPVGGERYTGARKEPVEAKGEPVEVKEDGGGGEEKAVMVRNISLLRLRLLHHRS